MAALALVVGTRTARRALRQRGRPWRVNRRGARNTPCAETSPPRLDAFVSAAYTVTTSNNHVQQRDCFRAPYLAASGSGSGSAWADCQRGRSCSWCWQRAPNSASGPHSYHDSLLVSLLHVTHARASNLEKGREMKELPSKPSVTSRRESKAPGRHPALKLRQACVRDKCSRQPPEGVEAIEGSSRLLRWLAIATRLRLLWKHYRASPSSPVRETAMVAELTV